MKKIMLLVMAAVLSAGTISTAYARQDPGCKKECGKKCEKKCGKDECTKKCEDKKTCSKETAKA